MIRKDLVDITKRRADIDRACKNERSFPVWGLGLYIVTDSTPIPNQSYRWTYTIKPAALHNSAIAPDYKMAYIQNGAPNSGFPALSVSELGNSVQSSPNETYSYGIEEGDLVGTIVPVKIPNGTPVVAMPYKTDNGIQIYLIINTQAITGSCSSIT